MQSLPLLSRTNERLRLLMREFVAPNEGRKNISCVYSDANVDGSWVLFQNWRGEIVF